jgi:hypothetical protein
MTEPQDHKIVIRKLGSGFAVTVEPPIDGEDLNGTFDAHRNARGWACGLRMIRRWAIIDLASDAWLNDMITRGEK